MEDKFNESDKSIQVNDVTGRPELAAERTTLDQRRLEASSLKSLGLLVETIAHNLSNLLVPILLSAELAKQSVEPGGPVSCLLATVIDNARQAAELTKQLQNPGGLDSELQIRSVVSDNVAEPPATENPG